MWGVTDREAAAALQRLVDLREAASLRGGRRRRRGRGRVIRVLAACTSSSRLPKDDPGYGARMPASNDALSADDLKRIHDWIARGALLSEPESAIGTVWKY